MKKDKNILIIIISVILILLASLIIFLINMNKDDNKEKIKTTSTTEKVVQEKELIDELTNISIKLYDTKYFDNKISIKKVENVKVEEVDDVSLLMLYDINLIDLNNNIVKVENSNLLISIPYDNVNNYNEFKVLHLDENNKVLEIKNANYQNGNVVFYDNCLSRYAIVGKKLEEQSTTQKTTTKITDKTNKTTTNSASNNDLKKEWTVTFYVDGKVSSVVKVKDGNTVTKPKNPYDTKNQVFSHWVNSLTGEKFDFNTKIYKNYEVFAYYKTKDDNQNVEIPTTTTTPTTIKKQYDTTITLYTGNAETPKKYTIKSGESKVLKYYFSYFKGQADHDAPVKINVTGNPDYTYVVSPKNSNQESGVPTPIYYTNNGGSWPYYIESEKVTYLNVFYYDENNQKEHAAIIMIYYVNVYLGAAPSYPISDGWTQELEINEKKSLNIYGQNFDGILCQSDNPNKLIVNNSNTKVEYYATESGYYTLTCYAKNFTSAKTVINISAK